MVTGSWNAPYRTAGILPAAACTARFVLAARGAHLGGHVDIFSHYILLTGSKSGSPLKTGLTWVREPENQNQINKHAHRSLLVDRSDGFRQQLRDRQRFDPARLPRLLRERNRIRKNHFLNARCLNPADRLSGKHRVGGAGRNARRRPSPAEPRPPSPACRRYRSGRPRSGSCARSPRPTTFITSATLASSRRLSMMARGAFNRLANARARSTPPASGETTVRSGICGDLKYSIITGVANR